MKISVQSMLAFLFPPRCCFCRAILKRGESGVCRMCLETLPVSGEDALIRGESFSVCLAPLYYEGTVRTAFHKFKFRGAANYAPAFGKLMAKAWRRASPGPFDLITWVPISARRMKKRGYDQSMLLAYAVALELDDVALETLEKRADRPAQSELEGIRARRENVSGAFGVRDPEAVEGKRILLIDDILTTGATFSECAATLLRAGAAEVRGLVFARARSPGR